MATLTDKVNQIYDENLEFQKTQMQKDFQAADANFTQQEALAKQAAEDAITRAQVESALSGADRDSRDLGLTSGAEAQLQFSQDNQLRADVGTIQEQQKLITDEINRQRALLSKKYESDIRKAQADNDMGRAKMLYEAAKEEEARLEAQQRAAAAAAARAAKAELAIQKEAAQVMIDEAGDYTRYGLLNGLTQDEIDRLNGKKSAPVPALHTPAVSNESAKVNDPEYAVTFGNSLHKESEHDAVMRAQYGSYKQYVVRMIAESGLSDAQKQYLLSKYNITSGDLAQKDGYTTGLERMLGVTGDTVNHYGTQVQTTMQRIGNWAGGDKMAYKSPEEGEALLKELQNLIALADGVSAYLQNNKEYIENYDTVYQNHVANTELLKQYQGSLQESIDFYKLFLPTEEQKQQGYTAEQIFTETCVYPQRYEGYDLAKIKTAIANFDKLIEDANNGGRDATAYTKERDWLMMHALTIVPENEREDLLKEVDSQIQDLVKTGEDFLFYENQHRAIENGLATAFKPGYIPYEEGTAEYWQAYQAQEQAYNEFVERKYEEYVRKYGSAENIKRQVQSKERFKWYLDKAVSYEFLEENKDFATVSQNAAPLPANSRNQYLSNEERARYNYLYHTGGKEEADQFLKYMQEELCDREATALFPEYEGKTAKEILFAFEAGFSGFFTNIGNYFNTEDYYIPQNTTQILSGKIREDLGNESFAKLPDWLGGETYAQAAFDFINTTSQMAPSILTSVALGFINPELGAAVGATTMGLSSAGGAYQEKINLGYGKDEARAYANLVGASETLLQYFIGGIGTLGKTGLSKTVLKNLNVVDNVFSRFAKSAVGKVLLNGVSEGIEEGLQSVLEPYFWKIVSGEEMEQDWGDTFYDALMGFASGLLLEGGNGVGKVTVNAVKNQIATRNADILNGRKILQNEKTLAGLLADAKELAKTANSQTQKKLQQQIDAVEQGLQNHKDSDNAAKNIGMLFRSFTKATTEVKTKSNTPHPSPSVTPSPQGEGLGGTDSLTARQSRSAQNDTVGTNNAYEDALALASNADKGTLDFAVAMYRQSGSVSNAQATRILNDPQAVEALKAQTGMELPGTASGNRAAVKNAIALLAQQQAATEAQTADGNTDGGFPAESQTGADIFQEVSAMARGENVAQQQESNSSKPNNTNEQLGVKEQIRSQQDKLNAMQPVTKIDVPAGFSRMDKASKQNSVVEKLRPTGYKVDRKGFGIIDFAKKRLKAAFKYFDNGSVEEAAFEALPYVLENGIEISSHSDHKGRAYRTVTIAAPVIINGKRGNMAVVVRQTDGNYYKVHRILTPNGAVFDLSETTNEADRADGGVTENGSLATSNGAASPEADVRGSTDGHRQAHSLIPASNNNIPETAPGVNPEDSTGDNPSVGADESVGAAPAGFDMTSHLQYEHGTIPEGENPVRPDDLPKKDIHGKDVSYTARTVKGAEVTPDDFVDLLDKDTVEGGLSYVKITNDATVQKAIDYITNEGWVEAKAKWHADVQNRKTGADLVATGALLLNNAAKAGDKAAWLDILHDYQVLGTNTAQSLQALRILKQLTPSDKLYMARRSIKQMVEDMKLDTEVTIDPELETEYLNAETDQQRDAVLKKIQKNVARQLPTTFMEKFTALRYVNMLGNLRTQGRNIVGNLTMMGTRAIHNAVATGIETVANKVSGGKVERTRSVILNNDQLRACVKDFDTVQEHLLEGGKFNDNDTATGFARGVQNEKQIFKFKPLEGYRKLTNWAMEQGDIIFAKDAYARALAGYLKAKGITETDLSKIDSTVMDDARLFAIKEAQEATFRDTNWLSGWVSKIGRRKDTPTVGKMISEGVMPFRKTPANVLVRAEEYSPLGVINSVVMSVKAAQKGSDITANQVINSWAKTLTGTGLFGLGVLLQILGLLSAGPDEDENKDDFEDLNGWQDYAITLPDGTNLTIDCFSPSAIPILMGAQLMKETNRNGFQLKDIGDALLSIADPLVEMSMLQGVNDTLENIQYADSSLGQLVINAAVGYLTQGLTNTLAGQIERSFEDSRMQTFVDKDSNLSDWLQRTLGKASAKIPGWDYNQIPYINAWGEEEKNPSTGLNLVYNLLSPVYFDKGRDDDLTRELNRLNDAQGDINVYPSIPDKTVTWDKKEYHLSKDEYVSLAKKQGQAQKKLVEDLIANSDYDFLSDKDKAKAIRYAYDYARDSARGEVIEEHPGITTKWMAKIKGDVADAIVRHVATGTTDKYLDLSVQDAAYVVDIFNMIQPESGKGDVRTIQKIEAVADADGALTESEQRTVMKDVLDEDAYKKFQNILALGYGMDGYAASYRIYLDEKKEGGKGTKDRIIKAFSQEFNITKNAATKLYECYVPPKKK